MKLITQFETYDNLHISIDRYNFDNSICVSLWNEEDGAIARLTTCLDARGKLVENESYLDTNNCPWAKSFIENYNLGEVSEWRCGFSGYCTYPIVTWDINKLKEYE